MTPLVPVRWRVDCRKQRGPWRTVLIEPYDLFCEAVHAAQRHRGEDWQIVAVVPVEGSQGEGRRLLAAGARVRDGGPRHD